MSAAMNEDWPIRSLIRQTIARGGPDMSAAANAALTDALVEALRTWSSSTDEGARWLSLMQREQERRQAETARRILDPNATVPLTRSP